MKMIYWLVAWHVLTFLASSGKAQTYDDFRTAEDEAALLQLHQESGLARGDIDLNGRVHFSDFLIFSDNYGRENTGYTGGDLDADGRIGIKDFAIFNANFGNTLYIGEPEPLPPNANLGLWVDDGVVKISSATPVFIGGIEINSPAGSLVPDGIRAPAPLFGTLRSSPQQVDWAGTMREGNLVLGDMVSNVQATSNDISISWFELGSYEVYTLGYGEGDPLTGSEIVVPGPFDPVDPNPLNEAQNLEELLEAHEELGLPRGDLNADGRVDAVDVFHLSGRFNNTAEIYSLGDLNLDGKAELEDLAILSTNFGATSFAPDPPAVERVEIEASLNAKGQIVLTASSPVEVGGIEIAVDQGRGLYAYGTAAPFQSLMESGAGSAVLANIGSTTLIDGALTTNIYAVPDSQFSLRWFQDGSNEVFVSPGKYLLGDIDRDGEVGFSDFLILSKNFGKEGTAADGDIVINGIIDFEDFLELSANYGMKKGPEAALASVPEPDCRALLMLAAMFGMYCRRRPKRL